ncbi:general odorant-binding protein 99a-like [Hermetia illucens]|uniref:general odorant-binding protein 99a-like n=1 Tax=Hermetia illucens TaxID=343691 RepID=UPI0018CC625B|nr:general odorant-binding protein 99a-like [Hermetia illucens]
MKFLVLLAVIGVAAATYTIKTHDDLIKTRGLCVKELNVPDNYVEKFKKWDFQDDETTRCYIKCVLNKMELFDTANGFNVENLVEQLGQNKDKTEVRTEVTKCSDKNEQKSDDCTWAYRGFKCFLSKHLQLVQSSVKS